MVVVPKGLGVSRPKLLDLFCCEGGATAGFQRAGFHVTGVDLESHPNYPGDDFHQGDAIKFLLDHGRKFDAIAGSPPCHRHSTLNAYNKITTYPNLIGPTRVAMRLTGRPTVIENVPGAPLKSPLILCGPMFGLNLYRHRLFETRGFDPVAPVHPKHRWLCVRNGYLPTEDRPFMSIHGGKHSRAWRERAAQELGIPWATSVRSVCEAIPPAYTEHIGRAIMAVIR